MWLLAVPYEAGVIAASLLERIDYVVLETIASAALDQILRAYRGGTRRYRVHAPLGTRRTAAPRAAANTPPTARAAAHACQ